MSACRGQAGSSRMTRCSVCFVRGLGQPGYSGRDRGSWIFVTIKDAAALRNGQRRNGPFGPIEVQRSGAGDEPAIRSPRLCCRPICDGPRTSRSCCHRLYPEGSVDRPIRGGARRAARPEGRRAFADPTPGQVWQDEHRRWQGRDLSKRYVYWSGRRPSPRLEHERQCILVVIMRRARRSFWRSTTAFARASRAGLPPARRER